MSSIIVMNNNNLRRIIFSYFRKKPEIVCHVCNKVCKWNNKELNRYVEISIYDHTVFIYYCINCYWYSNTRDIMGK